MDENIIRCIKCGTRLGRTIMNPHTFDYPDWARLEPECWPKCGTEINTSTSGKSKKFPKTKK